MTEIDAVLAGKYRVLAKLGEGGMGTVFRAENLLTGKLVALKCLHAHASGSADSSERLLREARAASRLSHPNVVDVYDIVRDVDALFLVMELLHGQTLREYLRDNPRPRITEFVSLMLPAMAGVAAAHAHGVIHRDLKPDNIFLAKVADMPTAVVKVLDFGIAKLAVPSGHTLTQTGMSLGTPLYMSLEQLRGDKDVDQRADVYAFGVMLYEAVTGSLPFEAETLPELAIKVATTDPHPVKSLRPDVPTPLARLIDGAVARDRNQRIASVRMLQQELETFARDHSFRVQMTQPDNTLPRLAPKADADSISRPEMSRTERSPQPTAAAVVTAPHAEPAISRALGARLTHVRTRWMIGGTAIVGAFSAVLWLISRQTPAAVPPAVETTIPPAFSHALVDTQPVAVPQSTIRVDPLPENPHRSEKPNDVAKESPEKSPKESPKLSTEPEPGKKTAPLDLVDF